jgi:hypothetical protein
MTASRPGHAVEALARALSRVNSWSRGSTSLVSRSAASASVRAMMTVGTSATSAASRAAFRVDVLLRGHQHLAAEVAALLLAGQLVLPVDAGTRLDQRLRELVRVEGAAEARLGIRDDGASQSCVRVPSACSIWSGGSGRC